jgi:hypothetical protein
MAFERSFTGNSSALLVDEAPHAGRRGRAKKERAYVARHADAIPRGMCKRCGLIGSHATAEMCIDALRDALAEK